MAKRKSNRIYAVQSFNNGVWGDIGSPNSFSTAADARKRMLKIDTPGEYRVYCVWPVTVLEMKEKLVRRTLAESKSEPEPLPGHGNRNVVEG